MPSDSAARTLRIGKGDDAPVSNMKESGGEPLTLTGSQMLLLSSSSKGMESAVLPEVKRTSKPKIGEVGAGLRVPLLGPRVDSTYSLRKSESGAVIVSDTSFCFESIFTR